jgi:CHAD domain-containing protein
MTDSRARQPVAPADTSRSGASSSAARPPFRPDDAFIVLAYEILRREAAALTTASPPTLQAPEPEEIHRLRVAARRLRVALRLFGRMLPSADAERFRADLKWFASSLGEVRDLDVYAENFRRYVQTVPPAQRRALSGYQLYLRRERKEARRKAAEAIASRRAAALLHDLAAFVAAGPGSPALRRWGSLTARDAMRQTIRRSVGRVRRSGNELVERARPAELHELRIRIKRLRYELEFFSAVYPPLEQAASVCKALQDLLGTHQDVYAGTARLRRYAALLRKQGGSGELAPALKELRRTQLALARKVRGSFRATWPSFVAAIGAARKFIA